MSTEQQRWTDQAFLIHHRHYRETSLLLTVFCRERGKMNVIARGANRPKSRLRAILYPFTPLNLQVHQRGSLGQLMQCEPVKTGETLIGQAQWCGLYINELLYRLCANHDPQPPIYDQYWATIAQLTDADHREAALRRFEWSLFEQLGHPFPWFQLDATDADTVMFDPESGFMTCGPDHPQGLPITSLNQLQTNQLDTPEARKAAKWLNRRLIDHMLHGKTLKCREWLG